MAITGITTSTDNGVARITSDQLISTTGTIDSECVVLDRSTSYLETNTSGGSISVTNSQIVLDSDTPTGNDETAVMNYGGRTRTVTTLSFVDTLILAKPLSSRHNIQVTELTRSEVIEGTTGTSQLFCYTGKDAVIDTVLFRNIRVWEIYATPSVLFSVTVDAAQYGYLNWEAGRLDFFNFAVANIPVGAGASAGHAWVGQGASNNACWHWNNDSSFDNTMMYLTAATNRYYEGFTATWLFIDRDTGSPIEDVLVVFRDDFVAGSMTTRGTYTTNSSGHLAGTYNSQTRSSGSDIERPTLFIVTNAVVNVDTSSTSPGTYTFPTFIITGDQGNRVENYDITPVEAEVEIRSYLHERPTGYAYGDTFTITEEIGSIASDLSVNRYQDFVLTADSGITASYATASAYSDLDTLDKLYDRTKAEWYDNDDYPLPVRDGTIFDLGSINLTVNGSAGSEFGFSGSTITIDTASLGPGTVFNTIETTGTVTLQNSSVIDNIGVNGDVQLTEVVDLDGITVTGTLDFDTAGTYDWTDATLNEITNSSGGSVTLNLNSGSTVTTNTGPNITVNIVVSVTVTIVNQSGTPIPGVEVAIFQDNISRSVILASTATDENGQVSTTSNASLGGILIRARQSTQTASFSTTAGVNPSTEVITTDSAHNFQDGDRIIYDKDGGTAAIGLTAGNAYFVNSITSTTLSLHASAANAIADTSRINLLATGTTETHLLDPIRYIAASASGTIGTSDFSAQITMVTDSIVTG